MAPEGGGPPGLCPPGGGPSAFPTVSIRTKNRGRSYRSVGNSLVTAFGIPLHVQRFATVGGLPTGIFMSHLLRQKGTDGLIGH